MLVHTHATTHCVDSGLVLLKGSHVLLHLQPQLSELFLREPLRYCTGAVVSVIVPTQGAPLIRFSMHWTSLDGDPKMTSCTRLATEFRVSTHLIVRLQRYWRRVREARRAPLLLAFCMGAHPRLGAQAPMHVLPQELLAQLKAVWA
jgi:hypothetical protein